VFVVGEPGVGKSRLARELAVEARRRGFGAVAGRAVAVGRVAPYRPLTEALAQLLRHRRLPDDPDLRPWLPALASILPLGVVRLEGRGDESAAVRGEAVLRLLDSLDDPALLVVLEDLHWADPDTLAVVEYLGDNLAGSDILCVATARSEPRSPSADLLDRLAARGAATPVSLGRLDREEVEAMVLACAPGASRALIDRVAAAADGVPFLVEELLVSPGIPTSFAETVRARLAEMRADHAAIVQAAAVLGRDFDWRLLATTCAVPEGKVGAALKAAVTSLLITVDGDRFRFRHALTREAVAATLLPPRRALVAGAALAAVEAAHRGVPAVWGDVAADLAAQAGDRHRAGTLLAASGRAAFERGALATAGETLRRAVEMLGDGGEHGDREQGLEARQLLVETLALAGRVDEAVDAGEAAIAALGSGEETAAAAAEVHLMVAHAAVAAGRWALASTHLRDAERLMGTGSPRADVLWAEVAINAGDAAGALGRAEAALGVPGCPPPVRCHALELVGRSHRTHDLVAARAAFEEALQTANEARLPVWRLRALHELGTVEMFDHAGTGRLLEARRLSDELGALSTGAVLDMHLAAALMLSFDFEAGLGHAQAAAVISSRLGLDRLHALSLMFLAQIHAMRLERQEMERFLALAAAAAPGDIEIEGSGWAGGRGMLALLGGDRAAAVEAIEKGVSMLRTVPLSGPACYRGLYPLLLAAGGDLRAGAAIVEARDLGMAVNRANRGLLAYAEAVLAGRRGETGLAGELVAQGEADLVHWRGWPDLARLLAAEAALAAGWGAPLAWLATAGASFEALGLASLAAQCRTQAGARPASRLDGWGVTERERDVLGLVAAGLANKEIAARLTLSPRTVEKHVESLLRKTGARSRTQLVSLAPSAKS
jgi:DNA-binding CsgD family transcriptional regulator/tetratricopeptide (TPR) repeat protein